MTLTVLTFYISLCIIVVLISIRIKAIRAKKIEVPSKKRPLVHTIEVQEFQKKLLFSVKNIVHSILLVTTRLSILLGRYIKRVLQGRFPKIYRLFWHDHTNTHQTPSFFIRSVSEYKYKMRRLKEKLNQPPLEEEE